MLLPLLVMLAADDVTSLMQTARDRTAAEHRCIATANSTDITVCGMRHADRFRVPFVVHDPGDPRHEGVSAERNRLLARTDNCQEKRAIQSGCGFAGVHMSTNGSGTTVGGGMRKMAP